MIKGYTYKIRRIMYEANVLYRCSKDERLPWYTRWIAYSIAFYVLGEMDLIPDFIPLIGYLDDFILVPLGIQVAKMLIPKHIYMENKNKARYKTIPESNVQWLIEIGLVLFWTSVLYLVYLKFIKVLLVN